MSKMLLKSWKLTPGSRLLILLLFLAGSTTNLFGQERWKGEHYDFSEGMAAFKDKDKFGFINQKKRIVIPAEYDYAMDFAEGLAAVEKDGLVGWIDKQGQYVLEPDLRYCLAMFKGGYVEFCEDNKVGLMNRKGETIIPPVYDYVSFLADTFASIHLYEKVDSDSIFCDGIISLNNQIIIRPESGSTVQLLSSGNFFVSRNSYACGCLYCKDQFYLHFRDDNKWKVVQLIRAYDDIGPFENGYAITEKRHLEYSYDDDEEEEVSYYGLIDQTGREVLPAIYDQIEIKSDYFELKLPKARATYTRIAKEMVDGLENTTKVEEKKIGGSSFRIKYNADGLVVPAFQQSDVLKIELTGKGSSFYKSSFGYIDKSGKQLLIPPQFGDAEQFENDIALVKYFKKECDKSKVVHGVIGKNGRQLPGLSFASIYAKSPNAVIVAEGDKYEDWRYGVWGGGDRGIIAPVIYSDVLYLENGYYKLMADEKFWLFHEERGLVFENGIPEKPQWSFMSNGIMEFLTPEGSRRYIDTTGFILDGEFDEAFPFNSPDKANVVVNGREFLIDREGREIKKFIEETQADQDEFKVLLSSMFYHSEGIEFIDLCPKGKYLLSADNNAKRVNIWNTYTAELIASNPIPEEGELIRFLTDSTYLVVMKKSIEEYNLFSGAKRSLALQFNESYADDIYVNDEVSTVAVGIERKELAVLFSGTDKEIQLIDLEKMTTRNFPYATNNLGWKLGMGENYLAFLEQLEAKDGYNLCFYDLEEEELANKKEINYAPDEIELLGDYAVTFETNDTVRIYQISTGRMVVLLDSVHSVRKDPKAKRFVLFCESGIRFFSTPEGQLSGIDFGSSDLLDKADAFPSSFEICDKNDRLFLTDGQGVAYSFSRNADQIIARYGGREEIDHMQSLSDSHLLLFSAGKGCTPIRLDQLATEGYLQLPDLGALAMILSPAGGVGVTYPFVGIGLNPMQIIDLEKGILPFNEKNSLVPPIFSKDGQRLYYLNQEGKVKVANTNNGSSKTIFEFEGQPFFWDWQFGWQTEVPSAIFIEEYGKRIKLLNLENGGLKTILTITENPDDFTNNGFNAVVGLEGSQLAYTERFPGLEPINYDKETLELNNLDLLNDNWDWELEEKPSSWHERNIEIVTIYDWQSKDTLAEIQIPNFKVKRMHHMDSLNLLVMTDDNGLLRFIDTRNYQLLDLMLYFQNGELLALDERRKFYAGSKLLAKKIRFSKGAQLKGNEQFELSYNRPDSLLYLYPFTDKNYAETLSRIIDRRAINQGVGKQGNALFCQITNDHPPYLQTSSNFQLEYEIWNTATPVPAKLFVKINGVTVHTEQMDMEEQRSGKVPIRLQSGENRIEIFARTGENAISNVDAITLHFENPEPERKLYFLGIANTVYTHFESLDFTFNDIRSAIALFKENQMFSEMRIDTFFNQKLDKEQLGLVAKRTADFSPDDYIIVYLSGHGTVDLSTGEFCFINPEATDKDFATNSLRYSQLEKVLQEVPAHNRLILIDACESGNIDKTNLQLSRSDDQKKDTTAIDSQGSKGLRPRATKNQLRQEEFELMENLFNNYNNAFGGVTLAASSGYENANEYRELGQGVFTHFLLQGLQTGAADLNTDGKIYMQELTLYLKTTIQNSTFNQQTVSTRSMNLIYDIRIW